MRHIGIIHKAEKIEDKPASEDEESVKAVRQKCLESEIFKK